MAQKNPSRSELLSLFDLQVKHMLGPVDPEVQGDLHRTICSSVKDMFLVIEKKWDSPSRRFQVMQK